MMVLIMLFYPFVCGCKNIKNKDYISYISFSPDSKKILFDRQKADGPYQINVFDLDTGSLSAYQSPPGENWSMARYSFDGKLIVFSIIPSGKKYLELEKMQIAVMDPDGKKVKRITNTPGVKIYPSFSHSRKKIIFCKAGKIRKSGKTPAADYDVYEVDIDTGQETRLSWFKFFMMSQPFYFPDDNIFIFSAYGFPYIFPEILDNDYKAIRKKQEELKSSNRKRPPVGVSDDIYVVQKGQKDLPAPYAKSIDGVRDPLITADGLHIYFLTQAYKPDGSGDYEQFFEYSKNGKHRRITNIKATTIWSGAVSPDGKLLAAVYDIAPNHEIRKIVIYYIKSGTSKEISLPDYPSRIINRLE